nr:MAG TPA: hypothetical protein [Caudoviricetes sp.]
MAGHHFSWTYTSVKQSVSRRSYSQHSIYAGSPTVAVRSCYSGD